MRYSYLMASIIPVNVTNPDSLKQARPRLPGLDYLRGLAAFGIMTYHYTSWTFGEQPANSFLGRVGIYGVAIFYILSGQTLSYIYSSRLQLVFTDLWGFYKKRFFRIFPLLWLATLLSILISKRVPNSADVFLNLTGLFGLVKWDVYFATGAWSIGNELCFYLIFPLLIFIINKHRISFFSIISLVASFFYYFAFHILNPGIPLAEQWHFYTNPLNHFLFFCGGVTIGNFIQPNALGVNQSIFASLVGLIIFVLLPIHGNAIELVTGPNRLFFTISCFLLCYSFFRSAHAPALIDKPLVRLGQASYSLYLLHPLVYAIVKAFCSVTNKIVTIPSIYILITSVAVSLVISLFSYQYFESFFIRISHKKYTSSTND